MIRSFAVSNFTYRLRTVFPFSLIAFFGLTNVVRANPEGDALAAAKKVIGDKVLICGSDIFVFIKNFPSAEGPKFLTQFKNGAIAPFRIDMEATEADKLNGITGRAEFAFSCSSTRAWNYPPTKVSEWRSCGTGGAQGKTLNLDYTARFVRRDGVWVPENLDPGRVGRKNATDVDRLVRPQSCAEIPNK
jgi:hypothetical protein